MAIDKVKPLKIENPATGGVQTDYYPTELNPAEDYASMKGICFADDSNFYTDKIGRAIAEFYPQTWQNVTYSGGIITAVEYFNNASFISANRIARHELSYTSYNLTGEILYIYDTNGTSVLRTYTWIHVYSNNDLASSSVVIV